MGVASAVGAGEGGEEEEEDEEEEEAAAAATGRPGNARSARTRTITSEQSAIVAVYRGQRAHSPRSLPVCRRANICAYCMHVYNGLMVLHSPLRTII